MVDIERNTSKPPQAEGKPLSLRELFGDEYKYSWDPAVADQRNPDDWFQILVCRYGEIYRYSNSLLAVMVTGPKIVGRMKRGQQFKVHQDGEDATVFLFYPEEFDIVAEYVKPRKQRRLPEAFKQRFVERGKCNLAKANHYRAKCRKEPRRAPKGNQTQNASTALPASPHEAGN